MAKRNHTDFDPSLDPNSKTYSLGLRLDRTWHAPGVRLMWTSHGQYFSGKAEALIASGLAEADWFPTDWKQRKLTVDGRSITVRRKSKYSFDVYVKYSPEEEERETERDRHATMKKRELKAEEERLEKEGEHLANLPKTAAEYRVKALALVNAFADWPISLLAYWNKSGFRYDEATMVELKRLIDEMQLCLQSGHVVFNPVVQADTFARHKAARAKADPHFQKVMVRLEDPSSLPE